MASAVPQAPAPSTLMRMCESLQWQRSGSAANVCATRLQVAVVSKPLPLPLGPLPFATCAC
jgi:hypothetical protein